MPAWEDKNLRIHDGDDVQIIACQLPPADGQPCLKVFGEEVGIVLLDPSANDASKVLTHINGVTYAFATLGQE